MKYSGFIQKVFQKLNKLDLNEIKNIMVELSTEKELYKLVFDSMIEGVIVTNKDNKVILINKAMEDFISVSKKGSFFRKLRNVILVLK
jgi:signal transduction histidine kinase